MNHLETIEAQYGKKPEDINAVPILSKWYGPASLVCHIVRPIDEKTMDAFFVVGQNICGPGARPPMFDHLAFWGNRFTCITEEDDAKEHLINAVGKGVVPGHNLAGLTIETGTLAFNYDRSEPADLMLTGFDFIRFKGLVLPGQELTLAGPGQCDKRLIEFTPTMTQGGQRRLLGRNFRLEVIGSLAEETRQTMLSQHWFLETTAQGLGVGAMHRRGKERVVPIFLEVGKGLFTPIPVLAGDVLRTRLELIDSEENQAYGNTTAFVKNQQVAELKEVLLEFFPVEQVFPETA